MTVALRMTGALIVAPAGTPDDPTHGSCSSSPMAGSCGTATCASSGGSASGRAAGCAVRRKRALAQACRGPEGAYRVGDVFGRHGPEPLAPTFTAAAGGAAARELARLKTLLLDQSFIAGVGNIYADEALWRARLHPLRPPTR